MFTGIISDIGTIAGIDRSGETTFAIATSYPHGELWIGQSIACDGACLTVVDKGGGGKIADWFTVQASQETLDKTTLGDWVEGTRINLEKALTLGQDLSGHLVTGHVDGVARIVDIQALGESRNFFIEAPEKLQYFIAAKGSVTLNGTSLTVNHVEKTLFAVTIIPHTQQVTTWGEAKPGDRVNLEIDIVARYIERLMQRN